MVSLLPDAPMAPSIRMVGAALDIATQLAMEKYRGRLNVSLVKATVTGKTCQEMDAETVDYAAKWYYEMDGDNACISFIGSGGNNKTNVLNYFLTTTF